LGGWVVGEFEVWDLKFEILKTLIYPRGGVVGGEDDKGDHDETEEDRPNVFAGEDFREHELKHIAYRALRIAFHASRITYHVTCYLP
jgi:hypothetical protein